MSMLSEYDSRTSWKYEPIQGVFHTHDGLTSKVNETGEFVPFPGTTVVFRADAVCIQTVRRMQQVLHRRLGETGMLAAMLPESTIHMTLHDLVSPERCASDPADHEQYRREMTESASKAAALVTEIQDTYAGRTIAMAADRIVNMVSKSLVLMLRPQSEQDFELLMDLYTRFNAIMDLPYPLTPHITLAYYRPCMLDGYRLGEAVNAVQIQGSGAPVFSFSVDALTAQVFEDMSRYADVPERICFVCDGGLNRSVMAACLLNQRAGARNLPVRAEARAAYPGTEGRKVPDPVWRVLEQYGITEHPAVLEARFLGDEDISKFSRFVPLSEGALDHLVISGVPEERYLSSIHFFHGIPDPEYGEATHAAVMERLIMQMDTFLDHYEPERT